MRRFAALTTGAVPFDDRAQASLLTGEVPGGEYDAEYDDDQNQRQLNEAHAEWHGPIIRPSAETSRNQDRESPHGRDAARRILDVDVGQCGVGR